MKRLRFIKNLLSRQGYFLTRCTDPQKIQKLIASLRPVETELPLIRIGNEYDGGYLLPDDLDGISECLSPGVGDSVGFENDLFVSYGIKSHLADHSINRLPQDFKPGSFTKKFIGCFDDAIYTTLDKWAGEVVREPDRDLILQMDIEGGEYSTILGVSERLLKKFRVIILEIHRVTNWADPAFFQVVDAFFCKLLSDFIVVHSHPNNCCGVVDIGGVICPRTFELTLIRKDRVTKQTPVTRFPHVLDRPNRPSIADLQLPRGWR